MRDNSRREDLLMKRFVLAACAFLAGGLPAFGIELKGSVQPIRRYMDRVFARRSFQNSLSEAEREMRQ